MYHAGWAWAGDTPFHHTKLVASHFGGTRNPLVVSWPRKIKPDRTPRPQFHHVNDIAPTLYEILGITPPKIVNGIAQTSIDGISMAYSFGAADAPGRKTTQYFENNGSRGIYHEGWYACAFGPFVPWAVRQRDLSTWDAHADVWELYDLSVDFSQSNDLAAQEPERLASLKALFLAQAKDNQVFPIGAGLWTRIHPEDRIKTAYSRWTFDASTIRMPEFAAPGLGRESNRVTVKAKFGPEASGVLYALGGAAGGVSLFIDNGILVYAYNGLMLDRNEARATTKLAAGSHIVVVDTRLAGGPASPAEIIVLVDGVEVARTKTRFTVPGAFSASESFNVGVDLGSPVSRDYAERRPFRFNGLIETVTVEFTASE
jgi:arylsulfatase